MIYTWESPFPEIEIATINFVSKVADSALLSVLQKEVVTGRIVWQRFAYSQPDGDYLLFQRIADATKS
jgi:hypothetical protein